jgi:hypothetical protein
MHGLNAPKLRRFWARRAARKSFVVMWLQFFTVGEGGRIIGTWYRRSSKFKVPGSRFRARTPPPAAAGKLWAFCDQGREKSTAITSMHRMNRIWPAFHPVHPVYLVRCVALASMPPRKPIWTEPAGLTEATRRPPPAAAGKLRVNCGNSG